MVLSPADRTALGRAVARTPAGDRGLSGPPGHSGRGIVSRTVVRGLHVLVAASTEDAVAPRSPETPKGPFLGATRSGRLTRSAAAVSLPDRAARRVEDLC